MAFNWLLQTKELPGLFSRRPWPSLGLDVMGESRHRIRWQSRARSLSSLVAQTNVEPCLFRKEPLSIPVEAAENQQLYAAGRPLKSPCKALLTVGCKYKSSYQTREIQEGRFSSVGPPSLSTECRAAGRLFSSRAVTTTRGHSLQAGPD